MLALALIFSHAKQLEKKSERRVLFAVPEQVQSATRAS